MNQIEGANSAWWVKYRRATKLFNELKSQIDQFESPKNISQYLLHWDGEKLVLRFEINEFPGKEISALFGDVLHNLHSSLDSIIFSILSDSASRLGRDISEANLRKIYFPILSTERSVKSREGVWQFGGSLLVSDLESHQPYKYINEFTGAGFEETVVRAHPLKVLNELSIRDKHRTINLVYLNMESWAIFLGPKMKMTSHKELLRSEREYIMEFSLECDKDSAPPSFSPSNKISIDIWADAWPRSTLLGTMQTMFSSVYNILNQLEVHLDPEYDPEFGFSSN